MIIIAYKGGVIFFGDGRECVFFVCGDKAAATPYIGDATTFLMRPSFEYFHKKFSSFISTFW